MDKFIEIKNEIMNDKQNIEYTIRNLEPLFNVNEKSKIIIIGQAPGIKAEQNNSTWMDLSGNKLRDWLGVSEEEFYNPDLFGQMPMDFYYPGKGKTGDLPPRKGFAEKWHKEILTYAKEVKLIILIGNYSQSYYLKDNSNLTTRVKNYKKYLPKYFVLPHPSPLNFRWMNNNPWFLESVLNDLRKTIKNIINN